MSAIPLLAPHELLLLRRSPFGNETGILACGEFAPGQDTVAFVRDTARVLVIGAGGLGCEVLKDLAMSGIRHIDVIDMDTIDVTNLNRQFLFRSGDVGKMKAQVAADFIMRRVPDCVVTPHTDMIQRKDPTFYQQFSLIIGGLDNIDARRWLNSLLHDLVQRDEEGNIDPSTIIPFVDGGSEAFKGQVRVIIPGVTSCFECSLDSFPPQVQFQLCTVAETPRKPEHCIAYIMLAVQKNLAEGEASRTIRAEWEAKFGASTELDKDDADHMAFLFDKAVERAQKHKIEGVTLQLTSGVVKRIIPAIASTNAAIAAGCVNEAWKYLSYGSRFLNSYMFYQGNTGVYSNTFEYEKKPDCLVCARVTIAVDVDPGDTLQETLHAFAMRFKLTRPSVSKPGKTIYMDKPESLRKQTEANLTRPSREFFEDGDIILVTDSVFPVPLELEVKLTSGAGGAVNGLEYI